MSGRSVGLLLEDMLVRIRRIEASVLGIDRETFLHDDKTVDAVVRNLTVIGEAANRLPQEFKDRHPEVPWRRIVGLRHRIVHDYFDVDLDIVWAIVQRELPQLETHLLALQAEPDADGSRADS